MKSHLIIISIIVGFVGLGYIAGRIDGVNIGYALSTSEQAARANEHERIMKYIGVCKWAKIIAADNRCQQELP